MLYYGSNGHSIPKYDHSENDHHYILSIGTIYKDGAKSGINRKFIIPGINPDQAIQAFVKWCKAVIEDVLSNMTQDDLIETKYSKSIDILHPNYKIICDIDNEISAISDELDDNINSDELYTRMSELRDKKEKLLTSETEINSRFKIIIAPVLRLIEYAENGWYRVETLPRDRPVPIGHYDDWRGFTEYQPK